MSKKNFSFIVLILLVIIAGYYLFFQNENQSIASEKFKPKELIISGPISISSNKLDSLILKAMDEQYTGKVRDIEITEISNVDNNTFVSFLLNEGNYYGVLYATKTQDDYLFNDISIGENNKKDKRNVIQSVGDTDDVTKRKYRVISGMINDKLDSVHIFYENGEYVIIKLDNKQKTFMHVNVGNNDVPSKIIGKFKDKEIFSINYTK